MFRYENTLPLVVDFGAWCKSRPEIETPFRAPVELIIIRTNWTIGQHTDHHEFPVLVVCTYGLEPHMNVLSLSLALQKRHPRETAFWYNRINFAINDALEARAKGEVHV